MAFYGNISSQIVDIENDVFNAVGVNVKDYVNVEINNIEYGKMENLSVIIKKFEDLEKSLQLSKSNRGLRNYFTSKNIAFADYYRDKETKDFTNYSFDDETITYFRLISIVDVFNNLAHFLQDNTLLKNETRLLFIAKSEVIKLIDALKPPKELNINRGIGNDEKGEFTYNIELNDAVVSWHFGKNLPDRYEAMNVYTGKDIKDFTLEKGYDDAGGTYYNDDVLTRTMYNSSDKRNQVGLNEMSDYFLHLNEIKPESSVNKVKIIARYLKDIDEQSPIEKARDFIKKFPEFDRKIIEQICFLFVDFQLTPDEFNSMINLNNFGSLVDLKNDNIENKLTELIDGVRKEDILKSLADSNVKNVQGTYEKLIAKSENSKIAKEFMNLTGKCNLLGCEIEEILKDDKLFDKITSKIEELLFDDENINEQERLLKFISKKGNEKLQLVPTEDLIFEKDLIGEKILSGFSNNSESTQKDLSEIMDTVGEFSVEEIAENMGKKANKSKRHIIANDLKPKIERLDRIKKSIVARGKDEFIGGGDYGESNEHIISAQEIMEVIEDYGLSQQEIFNIISELTEQITGKSSDRLPENDTEHTMEVKDYIAETSKDQKRKLRNNLIRNGFER